MNNWNRHTGTKNNGIKTKHEPNIKQEPKNHMYEKTKKAKTFSWSLKECAMKSIEFFDRPIIFKESIE